MQSAAWIHLRPRRWMLVAGAVLLALFVWAAWMSIFGGGEVTTGWGRWIIPLVLLYFAFMFGIWLPYQTSRIFRQRKDLHRPITLKLSDTGLVFDSEDGHGVKPWADYLKWKEGKAAFLLYFSDNMYQILPKRFFESEDEITQFRAFLTGKVKRVEA